MATAKKTKSGSWRIQIFDHDEIIMQPDGTEIKKKIRKSFTVNDPSAKGKRLCEKMAADWMLEKESAATRNGNPTIQEAINRHIDEKSNILSPSTKKGYRSLQRNWVKPIAGKRVDTVTESELQSWVNSMSAKLKPKSVKNYWGLVSVVINEYGYNRVLKVKLPQAIKPDLRVPTNDDITRFIHYLREDDPELYVAVLLGAFGGFRRSEVCGMRAEDVRDGRIFIRKTVVQDEDNSWVDKDTAKNETSSRSVRMPDFVISALPKEGKLVPLTPGALSSRFARKLKKAEVPHFRYHDLRHYSVSIMHAIGIPDQYIQARHGFKDDKTLKRIYRDVLNDYDEEYTDKLFTLYGTLERS